jgi:hypothetical protein
VKNEANIAIFDCSFLALLLPVILNNVGSNFVKTRLLIFSLLTLIIRRWVLFTIDNLRPESKLMVILTNPTRQPQQQKL